MEIVAVIAITLFVACLIIFKFWKGAEVNKIPQVKFKLPKPQHRTIGSLGLVSGSVIDKAKQSLDDRRLRIQTESSLTKYQALTQLKSLLDSGVISNDEFAAEKKKLL